MSRPRNGRSLRASTTGLTPTAFFLSCTNTTQIEAIAEIERALGKRWVNSNQAVLWGCMKRLKSTLGAPPPMPELGGLMRHMNG